MKKKFDGQYKTEKILYDANEYIISYFMRSLKYSFPYLGICFFVLFLMFFAELNLKYIVLAWIIFLLFWLFSFYIFWKWNRFIVSNKRIIKLIKSGFFRNHTNEIWLKQLNKFSFKKIWFFAKVLNYGTVRIISKDEHTTIRWNWIKYPNELIQYISRLKDFLNENPDFDQKELQVFKTRKERKKFKNK